MLIIQSVLIAVEVIVSLLLLTLILMQRAKNEGLGLAFGSGVGEALFGSRAGNILTKLTIIFAVIFMVNTTLLSVVYSGYRGRSLMSRFGIRPTAGQPMSQAPGGPAQRPASTPAQADGAPTLPGANLDEQGVPVAAPSAPAAPEAAPEESPALATETEETPQP